MELKLTIPDNSLLGWFTRRDPVLEAVERRRLKRAVRQAIKTLRASRSTSMADYYFPGKRLPFLCRRPYSYVTQRVGWNISRYFNPLPALRSNVTLLNGGKFFEAPPRHLMGRLLWDARSMPIEEVPLHMAAVMRILAANSVPLQTRLRLEEELIELIQSHLVPLLKTSGTEPLRHQPATVDYRRFLVPRSTYFDASGWTSDSARGLELLVGSTGSLLIRGADGYFRPALGGRQDEEVLRTILDIIDDWCDSLLCSSGAVSRR